ncbi:hypothetical protein D3C77_633290 [compost metagenome]
MFSEIICIRGSVCLVNDTIGRVQEHLLNIQRAVVEQLEGANAVVARLDVVEINNCGGLSVQIECPCSKGSRRFNGIAKVRERASPDQGEPQCGCHYAQT